MTRQAMTATRVSATVLACGAFLAACGGGGASGDGTMAQSVSFNFPGGPTVAIPPDVATITLVATASSGGDVTFTSNTPATCSVSGNTLSLLQAGECSVTATQAGGNGYAPASQSQLFVIPKRPQSIIFRNPGWQPLDSQLVPITATSSVDRPVVFTTSTPDVCSVEGNSLHKLANGLCTVTATQDGGDIFVTASVVKNIPIGTQQAPALTFLTGYKPDASATAENGSIGTYAGSNLDGWWCSDPNWCSSAVPSDGSSFSYSYKMQPLDPKHPNSDGWMGGYWGFTLMAGGLSGLVTTGETPQGVRIDAQAALKLNIAQNPEWFSTGSNAINVDLILGHFVLKADNSACNVKLRAVVTPTAADGTDYSVDLQQKFTVSEACGLSGLDPWFELQDHAISKIEISAVSVNTTVSSTPADYPTYPTTLTLTGGITFQ